MGRHETAPVFAAGAAGAVGRRLVPLLVAAGHADVATTRDPAKAALLEGLGARPVVVHAFDREGLARAVADARPAAVVHQLTDLAARDTAASARLRIDGTRNLVDAAAAAGVRRFVAQSIAFAYAPGDGPAAAGDHRRRRGGAGGGRGRAAGRGRPPLRAAPRSRHVARRRRRDRPRVRRGEMPATAGATSFLHVDVAARAAALALDWPPGIVNVVADEPAPGTGWLAVYAAALGAPPPVRPGAERGERGASNAKARRALRWQPTFPTWRTGFRVALG